MTPPSTRSHVHKITRKGGRRGKQQGGHGTEDTAGCRAKVLQNEQAKQDGGQRTTNLFHHRCKFGFHRETVSSRARVEQKMTVAR